MRFCFVKFFKKNAFAGRNSADIYYVNFGCLDLNLVRPRSNRSARDTLRNAKESSAYATHFTQLRRLAVHLAGCAFANISKIINYKR